MVANFAMSVLNGVGGAKLEKIVPFNTSSGSVNIPIPEQYKYIITEIVYLKADYNSTHEILDYDFSSTQIFFVSTDTPNIFPIVLHYVDSLGGKTESMYEIKVNFNGDVLNLESTWGLSCQFTGNIYFFN